MYLCDQVQDTRKDSRSALDDLIFKPIDLVLSSMNRSLD
jgi:hypothetical protein